MIYEEVLEFIKREPVYAGMLPAQLTGDFLSIDSGLLDSLGIFTLIQFIEKRFHVAVQPQDISEQNFRTAFVIAKYIEGRLPGSEVRAEVR